MDTAEPTLEDYRAAEEVLARNPPSNHIIYSGRRNVLAQMHAMWPRDKFQLRCGLRPPKNGAEAIELEYFSSLGAMTNTELSKRLKAEAEKDIDEAMLEEFFDDLDDRLECYGEMLVALIDLQQEQQELLLTTREEERHIAPIIDRMRQKGSMLREHRTKVELYLDEVRLQSGLGICEVGTIQASSAAELTRIVMDRARRAWALCCRRAARNEDDPYYGGTAASALFYERFASDLPKPNAILALLQQEWAAARLALRACGRNDEKTPTGNDSSIAMQINQAEISIGSAEIKANQRTETESVEVDPATKVDHWSELGIGIDVKGYLAFIPPPQTGERISKGNAIPLTLSGNRWRIVLEALAESPGGQSVPVELLIRKLGYLPPAAQLLHESRVKRRELEGALSAELKTRAETALNRLKSCLLDLNRLLQKQVTGPSGREQSALWIDAATMQVHSRFVVRCLVADESQHTRFGNVPRH